MERTRIRRELGRIRTLVSGVTLGVVVAGSSTLLACRLHCPETPLSIGGPIGTTRAPDESDEAWRARCLAVCREELHRDDARCLVEDDGTTYCEAREVPTCAAGRPPFGGFHASGTRVGESAERWLRAQVAGELASVHAFESLARTIDASGLDAGFARAARRFGDDERIHARLLFETLPTNAPVGVRGAAERADSPLDVAIHNASEACVAEVFGARLAAHQATHAPSAALRAAFARIALDEARHARFALALDGAFRARLGRSDARALDDAFASSVARLREAVREPLGPDGLGLPPPEVATEWTRAMFGDAARA